MDVLVVGAGPVGLRSATVDKNPAAVFGTSTALPPVFEAVNPGFLGGRSGFGIAYPAGTLTVHDSDTVRVDTEWQIVLGARRDPEWTVLSARNAGLSLPRWATLCPAGGSAAADLDAAVRRLAL